MDLLSIEKELTSIITKDKQNWTHFYLLLKQVEKEQLWKDNFRSFTSWVKDFCIKTKTHESIIWSRKKAGEVYQSYVDVKRKEGIEVAPIESVTVAQDTLVLLDKISRKEPYLGADLMDKALSKEITKKDLQEAYKTLRDKQGKVDRDKSNIESYEDIKKESITAAEIVSTLYSTEWLGEKKEKKYFKTSFEQDKYRIFTEFPVYTGSSRKSRRVDVLVAENISTDDSWQLNIHAIEIKVSKSDLLHDNKYTEYAEFVDFLWLAVPEDLIEVAKENKPSICGIISIKNKKAYIVEAPARLNPLKREAALTNLVLKLL